MVIARYKGLTIWDKDGPVTKLLTHHASDRFYGASFFDSTACARTSGIGRFVVSSAIGHMCDRRCRRHRRFRPFDAWIARP